VAEQLGDEEASLEGHAAFSEDGQFRFPKVLAGSYKLTNRIAGQPIWRLRVELKPGEQKQLELTPANSTATRDDFPETR
jgi:hypothetical protein